MKDVGAVGDGLADDAKAFSAAYSAARASNSAITIPAGTYRLGTKFTISHSKVRVVALGEAVLHFTGIGNAVEIDGGATGGGIYEVVFGGDLPITIKGNPKCTNALYMRAAHHCHVNVNVRDCSSAGLRTEWCIFGDIKFICSDNEVSLGTKPAHGIYLDHRKAGENTVGLVFIDPIIEIGTRSEGIHLEKAQNCVFLGGGSEGNLKGLVDAAGCLRNQFDNFWFEANAHCDAELYGASNDFTNCRFGSLGSVGCVEMVRADGNTFRGGWINKINLQAKSSGTSFFGVGFDSTPGEGVQGPATYRAYGCYLTDGGENYKSTSPDVMDPPVSWTPTVTQKGPVAATVERGRYQLRGNLAHVQGQLSITGSGSAGNAIVVGGIPSNIKPQSHGTSTLLGNVYVFDAGVAHYVGVAIRLNETSFRIQVDQGTDFLGVNPSFALATNDRISFNLTYEIA